MRFTGKCAIVTGAGRGIGRGIAARLSAEGALVGCVDIDGDLIGDTVRAIEEAGGRAIPLQVDLRTRAACHQAVETFVREAGRLDVLVNNAMWIKYEPIESIAEATARSMLAIGLEAVLWLSQAAIPAMRSVGGGAIVNVSSPAAVHGIVNGTMYCAVKGAIAALTRAMATELGPQRIRVNAIGPGPTQTPGACSIVDADGWQRRLEKTPLGRHAEVSDHAALCAFLASDDSAFMTGELVLNDGGRHISA